MVTSTHFSAEQYQAISSRLGHHFNDSDLLFEALTHRSVHQKRADYQRLEFLGDRVLGLVIAEAIYRQRPELREGALANLHSHLVRGEVCGQVARDLRLQDFVQMGQTEHKKGVHLHEAILGDVMEAVIGSIFLDAGWQAAQGFILKHWTPYLVEHNKVSKDPKTFLQEWALGNALPLPDYKVINCEGLAHSPVFTVELTIKNRDPATGVGASKRVAEMDAATQFLKREGLR